MRVSLYLGCWGTSPNGFTLCSGCENRILDMTSETDRNIGLADYVDKAYGLFDRPLYSNVHTALFTIQEKFSKRGDPVFSKELFAAMERFCVMHSRCGLFLRLKLEEEDG